MILTAHLFETHGQGRGRVGKNEKKTAGEKKEGTDARASCFLETEIQPRSGKNQQGRTGGSKKEEVRTVE